MTYKKPNCMVIRECKKLEWVKEVLISRGGGRENETGIYKLSCVLRDCAWLARVSVAFRFHSCELRSDKQQTSKKLTEQPSNVLNGNLFAGMKNMWGTAKKLCILTTTNRTIYLYLFVFSRNTFFIRDCVRVYQSVDKSCFFVICWLDRMDISYSV